MICLKQQPLDHGVTCTSISNPLFSINYSCDFVGIPQLINLSVSLLSGCPKISMVAKEAVRTGDIAVTGGTWSLTGTDADGEALEMSGRSVEVVRRQADGTWLFAIDLPNGAEG